MLLEREEIRGPRGSGVQAARCSDEESVGRERENDLCRSHSFQVRFEPDPKPRSSDVKTVSFSPTVLPLEQRSPENREKGRNQKQSH